MNRDQWARSVLLSVSQGLPLAALQAVQAVARLESGYGSSLDATANNWGSIHCTAGPPCGEGCFEHPDTDANGKTYSTCFRRYASPEEGAADLLRELIRRPQVRAVLGSGSAMAIANAMHASKYFEAKPAVYGSAMARNAASIASAIGEPVLVTLGGVDDGSELVFLAAAGYFAWRMLRRRKG